MNEGSWTGRTNSACTSRGLNAPGVQMEYSCSAVGCSAICQWPQKQVRYPAMLRKEQGTILKILAHYPAHSFII